MNIYLSRKDWRYQRSNQKL